MAARDVRMCGFAERRSVEEATALLDGRIDRLEAERVAVTESVDRVAAEDVAAAAAVPHFRRAMMDGYAVVAEDTLGASDERPARLGVIGEARAGAQSEAAVTPGCALRITTGAPVPPGADAVVMAELCEDDGVHVLVHGSVSPGKHVAPVGEDVAAGEVVVEAGRRLRPQDAGVIASVGVAEIAVVRRPRVRIVITGNELLPPGDEPTGAKIADANSVVLSGLLARDGGVVESIARVRDEPEAICEAMVTGDVDAVLLSGGSSVGPEDHAPRLLAERGELTVHGVAMRPSSPTGFGFAGAAVFLLPGNPVSCLCAYEFFAGPAIRKLGGRPWRWPHPRRRGRLSAKIVSQLGRTDFMRVRFDHSEVAPIMTSGASILSSTTRADGVVIVPDGVEGYPEGAEVEVWCWP